MENAVKALLIAAAVLIAILIITLGLVVYNRASETVNSAGDLSEYQIQRFNEKFLTYEGTNVTGTDVNALLQTAFNHNQNQADTTTCITVTTPDTKVKVNKVNNATATPGTLPAGQRYDIVCTIDAKSKLVTSIQVTAAK